jgi:hypothetical protein
VKVFLFFSVAAALLAVVALGVANNIKHECNYTTARAGIVGDQPGGHTKIFPIGHTKTCSWKLK